MTATTNDTNDIVVTRNGVPVALIVGVEGLDRDRGEELVVKARFAEGAES